VSVDGVEWPDQDKSSGDVRKGFRRRCDIILLTPDWLAWLANDPELVLEPDLDYEGSQLALEPSLRGNVMMPVRQLRDPAIYQEDCHIYLLHSVAGEHVNSAPRWKPPSAAIPLRYRVG
jgi:hypothetical protein